MTANTSCVAIDATTPGIPMLNQKENVKLKVYTIMNDIKEKLIHLLGGVTKDEHKLLAKYEYYLGTLKACDEVLAIMKKAYGMPADQWAEYVYDETKAYREDCSRLYHESEIDLDEYDLSCENGKEMYMFDMKEKVIHLLGGLTHDEHYTFLQHEHDTGALYACIDIMEIMEEAYGMPAEQWVNHVYENTELYSESQRFWYNKHRSHLEKWGLL